MVCAGLPGQVRGTDSDHCPVTSRPAPAPAPLRPYSPRKRPPTPAPLSYAETDYTQRTDPLPRPRLARARLLAP